MYPDPRHLTLHHITTGDGGGRRDAPGWGRTAGVRRDGDGRRGCAGMAADGGGAPGLWTISARPGADRAHVNVHESRPEIAADPAKPDALEVLA